ncbi:hypothetical protein KDA00_03990 [Candidatus Saccharibacteria bacterium]|nr:hypothetical protein [Candidatus Saccharibacteria bacterium]
MAATLRSPVDGQTGIPLPIAPSCEWLPVNQPEVADIHHGVHPRNDPRLLTVAGFAFRHSWLQTVERDLHNEGPFSYHSRYIGPKITTDEDDIFSRLLLITSGVIPNEVIDMNGGDPYTRPATAKETEFLHTPSDTDPFGYRYIKYRYEPIRDFFRHYVLKQKLGDEHIAEKFIDEFFFTKNHEKKRFLGHLLIAKAAEAASDQAGTKYRMLQRAGLMHPAMPSNPTVLVKHKLGNDTQRVDLIPTLEDSLRRHYQLEAA